MEKRIRCVHIFRPEVLHEDFRLQTCTLRGQPVERGIQGGVVLARIFHLKIPAVFHIHEELLNLPLASANKDLKVHVHAPIAARCHPRNLDLQIISSHGIDGPVALGAGDEYRAIGKLRVTNLGAVYGRRRDEGRQLAWGIATQHAYGPKRIVLVQLACRESPKHA